MDLLKLIALDREDLEIVSAHLQDAVVKIGEVLWRPGENRVVIALNRFDWEAAVAETPSWQRRRAALRFDRVLSCKCRGLDCSAKDQLLNLLAIEFTETDQPSGVVTLSFSGGGALRLEVECLEAEAVDLGPIWQAPACPDHQCIDVEPVESKRLQA